MQQIEMILPVHRPLVRTEDPPSSRAAAAVVEPALGKIQQRVVDAFRAHGPMTARRAERLVEFEDYGFSTIRKRISELASAGVLEEVGTDDTGRAPCAIYALR